MQMLKILHGLQPHRHTLAVGTSTPNRAERCSINWLAAIHKISSREERHGHRAAALHRFTDGPRSIMDGLILLQQHLCVQIYDKICCDHKIEQNIERTTRNDSVLWG